MASGNYSERHRTQFQFSCLLGAKSIVLLRDPQWNGVGRLTFLMAFRRQRTLAALVLLVQSFGEVRDQSEQTD